MLKKFLVLFFSISLCFFAGCTKQSALLPYISELRLDVYEGSSQDYELKANYGFREKTKRLDGIVGEKNYVLSIILQNYDFDGKITATIEIDGLSLTEQFVYNPVSSKMTAEFPVDDMSKTFDVTVSANAQSQTVTMISIVPENTVTYQIALNNFEEQQPMLIENYKTNGEFNGEIAMRIIVRNGSPYWYLGITDRNGKTKALLIDGISCEILAVKDIF